MSHTSKVKTTRSTRQPIILDETLDEFETDIGIALEGQLVDSLEISEDSCFEMLEGVSIHLDYDKNKSEFVLAIKDPNNLLRAARLIPESYRTFICDRNPQAESADHVFYARNLNDLIEGMNQVLDDGYKIDVPVSADRHWIN